jgi:uncharacterized DUF497 family protein
MEFEYDSSKSQSNQEKHKIDFVEAQRLWADPDRIEIPAKTEDEPRYLVIGNWQNSSEALVSNNYLSKQQDSHYFCSSLSCRRGKNL